MKSLFQFAGGVLLRTIAAPVVITGKAAQATGTGIIKTGVAIHEFGESAELKGLRMSDDGTGKVTTAKIELAKSREERKLELEERRKQKAEEAIRERRKRIQELEVASTIRKQMKQATPAQLAELTGHEFHMFGQPAAAHAGV